MTEAKDRYYWIKIGRCGKAHLVGSGTTFTACMSWPMGPRQAAPAEQPRCKKCREVAKRLLLAVAA